MLNWLKQFSTFCFLDSCNYSGENELILGAGVKNYFSSSDPDALTIFQQFHNNNKSWLFGHLGYELSTSDSIIRQPKKDSLGFTDLHFFEPEIVLIQKQNEVEIFAKDPEAIFATICQSKSTTSGSSEIESIQCKLTKEEYLQIINTLKEHIHRGDCYEINYCLEFFSEKAMVDPFQLYEKLNQLSPNPFSGLYRINDKWLICASPERYLKKTGNTLISQPIKGTLKRNPLSGRIEEEQQQLLQSSKDRAENVMVVDLVRNDLSRICKEGTVQVEELFGIYTFPQVHQMISTIKGTINDDVSFSEIIDATFPMGSMTGAPKINVMKLIDKYEISKRGIFSGSIGYITPQGDFDFNVVIRSIMYNQTTQYLSWQAGSGITIYSDPENEWEECMLKAQAIKEILTD